LAVVTTAASLAALDLQGSDRLAEMTRSIIQTCGTTSLGYAVNTSNGAEASLLAGTQLLAPMTRFLGTGICSSATLSKASGVASAIDALAVTGSTTSAGTCGGIRFSGDVTVGDTVYTFANWRDVLRVLFTGVQHDGVTDCNGPVRQALANDWNALFQGTCTGGGCTAVQRLWRSGERSDSTSMFLSLLALSAVNATSGVFCNGTEQEDKDPIRRPCSNDEQVCSKAGDLGLVVPVLSTDFLPAGDAFPTAPCTSSMMLAQVAYRPEGGLERCPNGDIPVFGNLCLVPVDANGNPACLATKKTKPAFIFDNSPLDGVTPSRADGRVYNLHLHKADGSYQVDTSLTPSRQMSRAFHRVHSKTPSAGGTACLLPDSTRQIGCLAQASTCSLGFAGLQAVGASPLVSALDLNGVALKTTNVRNLVARVTPVYPLSQVVFLNTLSGFNELPAIDAAQSTLANCFFTQPTLEGAATAAGLVTLGKAPFCQDFNEMALCGAPRNDNACGVSFNICPGIDSIEVTPLETRVGTSITLRSSASDIDNAPQPLTSLWSTTLGSIAAPDQPNTTYTCTGPGTATITLTITDGDCPDTRSVPVTCSP
jgi:hypothetical protein